MSAERGDGPGAAFVAIVNYRTGALVVECLRSLEAERTALRGGRVIVVDNASGDDSLAVIAAAIEAGGWQAWAELVALPRNGGFAYGNNRAIERMRSIEPSFDAVVCVNPDAVVRPGALAALLARLRSDASVGIVGAAIVDGQGAPQRTAHRFPSALGEMVGAAQLGALSRWYDAGADALSTIGLPSRCDWVSGACFAVRRIVLEQIGAFDEGYFLYFEETDLCLRARRAGWTCLFEPAALAMHLEGAATGIRTPRQRRPAYWYASRRRYFVKAGGRLGLIGADLLWMLGRASLVARRALGFGGRFGVQYEPRSMARDLLLGDAVAMTNGDLRAIQHITSKPQ